MDWFKKYIYHIIILIFLLIFFLNSFKKRLDLKYNYEITKGKIIDYHFNNNDYILDYEFEVDSVKYTGWIVVKKFNCDSVPFCKNNFFKVYYNPKNPKNNTMYLERYSQYQENPLFEK